MTRKTSTSKSRTTSSKTSTGKKATTSRGASKETKSSSQKSKTAAALKKNTETLTSATTKTSKKTTTSTPKRQARGKRPTGPKYKYTRSKDLDLFPHVNTFPWRLEPRNGSNMNIAWFQCYEHAEQHIDRYNITKFRLQCHTSIPITHTADHRA